MTNDSLNPISEHEKYQKLGGIFFPILQQDGVRQMVKINNGDHRSDIAFLHYLRQHDRQIGPNA